MPSPGNAFKFFQIKPCLRPRYQVASFHTARLLRQHNASTGTEDEPTIKDTLREQFYEIARSRNIPLPPSQSDPGAIDPRLPRSVQALYLQPARRQPSHNIPVATLQLRSYSVRNLEFMADFAVRAAYYLDLPAKGPVPLPRITQRWTVPRSVFVHKKSQENWERVTLRRLVQIVDGDPEVVRHWLSFVRRWCWYGVGMKANVWEHQGLEESKEVREEAIQAGLKRTNWELVGRKHEPIKAATA